MDVYSPREDSFLLIDCIKKEDLVGKDCLDLGCGSGVVSEAMLLANPRSVTALDINSKAVLVTKQRIKLFQNSFLNKSTFTPPIFSAKKSNLFSSILLEKFDLIAFNPPYLPSDEIKWVDLDGGVGGREVINKFVIQSKKYLKKNGVVLLLVSTLNDLTIIKKFLKKNFLIVRIVGKRKIFFEELVVFRCEKSLDSD